MSLVMSPIWWRGIRQGFLPILGIVADGLITPPRSCDPSLSFACTNSARGYFERLSEDYCEGKTQVGTDGVIRGPDGLMLENHGMVDNLMLDGGIDAPVGTLVRNDVPAEQVHSDLWAFEECLQARLASSLTPAARP